MPLSLTSHALSGTGPAILAHGGAWAIPDDVLDDHRAGLRAAIDRGRAKLEEGAAGLDVATAVVATLEADGAFDAGCGAMLNQDGTAELDAGVMDGATLAYGSVMATTRLAHPVRVARRLLEAGEGKVRMLAAEGAERFAQAEGFDLVTNDTLVAARERERYERLQAEADRYHPSRSFLPGAIDAGETDRSPSDAGHDTVGCVVRDEKGRLAAATSTGGTPFKPPGRVGDSPLPGSGFYATEHAAASATGWGEAIAAVVLAHRVASAAPDTAPEAAVRDALETMHARILDPEGNGAAGGLILLTSASDGEEADAAETGAWAFTTPRMACGGWQAGGDVWVQVGEHAAE
jgi:beta-aspartyl-peptidase (threonine type)